MHFVDAKGILTGSGGHLGMNIYRGCTHGCVYCDSRSRCYQFDHLFEDIEVKQNAPELLAAALRSKRRQCMIGTGSMSRNIRSDLVWMATPKLYFWMISRHRRVNLSSSSQCI